MRLGQTVKVVTVPETVAEKVWPVAVVSILSSFREEKKSANQDLFRIPRFE